MKNDFEIIVSNKTDFIHLLKTKFSLFHLSNIFFRDVQYGIMSYAEARREHISYGRAEELAKLVINNLEGSGILKPIKPGSWMLNYPEFRTPSAKATPPSSAPKANAPTPAIAGTSSAAVPVTPSAGAAATNG
jgi:hypothetical protein